MSAGPSGSGGGLDIESSHVANYPINDAYVMRPQ